MPLGPSSALLRSAIFRLTLINAGLLALAMVGAGLGGWLITKGTVERDARDRISLEAHAIAVELVAEGEDRAGQAIRSRSKRPGALQYLLVGPKGQRVAGNLMSARRTPGWHNVEVHGTTSGMEGKERLITLTLVTSDGSTLTVGDDLGREEVVREAVFSAIAVSGGLALILGLLAGIAATIGVLRRMRQIIKTVQNVEAGEFFERIQGAGEHGDDVDELALAINRMLDRIVDLVATIRRVSAEIAHDLRTPLTRVKHALDAAVKATDAGERLRAIEAAGAGVDVAIRLFNAMLDLAEIDAGDGRMRFSPVDLAVIAEQVVDAYRAEIEASGRQLALITIDTAVVEGDLDLITRAMSNLLDNALKHSRPRASITVRVDTAEGHASLCVADDGPGVRPEDVATMMRPFGRLDVARASRGNGLGLAIVGAIAKVHHAKFDLVVLDPGVEACIRFPLHRPRSTPY